MLVSIYMPTKNRLDTLKAAVDSVLNQSYTNLELIIVDDASTDGTADFLKAIQAQDARVKYFRHEKSQGACVARNVAIKSASGTYVTGLDDDDEFEPFHIASLVSYWSILQATPLKVSALYVQYKYRNNGVFSYDPKASSAKAEDMFINNKVGNQLFSTRENFIGAGLFDESMPAWQDLEFFYRVLHKYGPAKLLDIESYIFDVTPRTDRISSGSKTRILDAWKKMTTNNGITDSKQRQMLLLQVYADYYGFKISLADLWLFYKQGWGNRANLTITKRWFKKLLKR